jgi:arsenate reductase
MAEGFFRHHGQGKIEVASAGLSPSFVNPRAIEVMNEIGIDISGHSSDPIDDYLDGDWDYVITVCDNARERCPVFPGAKRSLHWPFEDPADVEVTDKTDEEKLAVFRKVRDEISARVREWLADRPTEGK